MVVRSVPACAVVAGLATVLPGLDTALVVRSVPARGRRFAAGTAAGIVGATVSLVVLGVGLLVRASRVPEEAEVRPPRGSSPLAVLAGFGTNLANPKVGVFSLAAIPQSIPAGTVPVLMGLALARVQAVLGLTWFGPPVLRRPTAAAWIDRITRVVLIGFGVRLAVEPR